MKKALYWSVSNKEYLKLLEQWEQDENHKWCHDCKHFYYTCDFGYRSCNCHIHGSLDIDQRERHPAETAEICEDYVYEEKHRNLK